MGERRQGDVVLLVERDRELAMSVAAELRAAGVRVRRLGTLARAREELRSEKFAAVLLDTRFPRGSGYQLAAEVRKEDPDAPVIFLARSSDPDAILYVERGVGASRSAVYDDLPVLADRVRTLLRH